MRRRHFPDLRAKVEAIIAEHRRGDDECWEWSGTPTSAYGRIGFTIGGRHRLFLVHRVVYEHMVGPVSPDLDLDHLCRNTRCMNPRHLDPVPHRINILRGRTRPAANRAKTHCLRGHELAGDNLHITPKGKRHCRACSRERQRDAEWQGKVAARLRTHCPAGHPYSGDNLVYRIRSGARVRACKACAREYSRRQREKHRAA